MTNARLAVLADMLVNHICYRRPRKALLISQFLRRHANGRSAIFTVAEMRSGQRGRTTPVTTKQENPHDE